MSFKKSVNVFEKPGSLNNCFFENGVLKPGYACVNVGKNSFILYPNYAVYSSVKRVYFACNDDEMIYSTTGYDFMHYADLEGNRTFLIEDYVNEEERAILISGDVALVHKGRVYDKIVLKHKLHCGIMHCGRLFGGYNYYLRWSGPGGFADWEEGIGGAGHVQLDPVRGTVINLVEYGEKLIAVRNFGLTVMNVNGPPENFSIDLTDTDCDMIYSDTACVFDGKLYFFSLSGLKCFDGSKIIPIELGLGIVLPYNAVMFEGKYYLACSSKDLRRDVIHCIDLKKGTSFFIDDYACWLYVSDNLRMYNDTMQKTIEKGGSYIFESEAIDFGTDRFKTVTEIKVTGKAKISISNGRFTRMFTVENGSVRPRMRGKSFTVKAEGKDELKELSMTAEVTNAV